MHLLPQSVLERQMGFSAQKAKQKAPSLFRAFLVVKLQSLQELLFLEPMYPRAALNQHWQLVGKGLGVPADSPGLSEGHPNLHLSGLEISSSALRRRSSSEVWNLPISFFYCTV